MRTVAVVDYGMGNLRSVAKALEHVAPDHRIVVTADPAVLAAAERIVVPGQGAMPDCMREFNARGLREAVLKAASEKPFLGICIGLQMLFEFSEEGNVPGLGLLAGRVKHFPAEAMHLPDGTPLKVPHMGWNEVNQSRPHALWNGIDNAARFYFVHSYYVVPEAAEVVAATCDYGLPFTAAVTRDNIAAVQFHPEKSADVGLHLLGNFIRWNP